MTGAINMGAQEINNVFAIRTTGNNVIVGAGVVSSGLGATGNILLGDLSTSNGSNSVAIGLQSIVRNNGIAIGKESAAGVAATVIGYRSSCGLNADTIVVGRDNVSSGGANADIIGVNRTNNQANTLLLGNGSYANIRANNGCDLGTALVPFQSAFLSGSISGANCRQHRI